MGNPGNPPDKPYQVITLSDDDQQASAQLQAALAAGFDVLFFSGNRVIVGNYRGR